MLKSILLGAGQQQTTIRPNDVILIPSAGQSNDFGAAPFVDLPIELQTPTRAKIWNESYNLAIKGWQGIIFGTTNPSNQPTWPNYQIGNWGYIPKMAQLMESTYVNDIYFFKWAYGSTSINEWLNILYYGFEGALRKAVKDILNTGKNPIVPVFFWMQGENDLTNSNYSNECNTFFVRVLALMDEILPDNPYDILVYYGRVADDVPGDATIIRQQQGILQGISSKYFMYDTDGYSKNAGDLFHYDAAGQIQHGLERFNFLSSKL